MRDMEEVLADLAYCVGITYIEKGPSEKEDAYED